MKICIVKLSAMGDIIHSMVVLQFLKKHIPHIEIDWIVEKGFVQLLQNNPDIDHILPIDLKSVKQHKLKIFEQIKLLKEYSKNNYDFVIDAQGLIKSAIVSKIVATKHIIGFDKDSIREKLATKFYTQTISIGYEQNVITRNVKVVCEALNVKVTHQDILDKQPFLYTSLTIKDLIYPDIKIVFVVGASKKNKIYPKEKFLELALKLNQKILVVWGNQVEYDIAKWLEQKTSLIEVAPKLNLDALKLNLKYRSLIIGADTGPTHMAWGLNVPSITIFGNTPHTRNTYITDINKVVKSKSTVDPLKLDKMDFSIQDIDVEDIIKKM